MDEARIKELYRRHTQAALPEAGDIVEMLSRHGASADEAAALDRVAASAAGADIARTVAALGPDIESLTSQVRLARQPQVGRLRTIVRRSFALAAGVGALAVLFTLMPRPGQAPGAPAVPAHEPDSVIMSVSFEPSEQPRAASRDAAIFKGNFDS